MNINYSVSLLLLMSLQLFDTTILQRKTKQKTLTENEEAGCMQLCVHVIICLNIYTLSLSVVGQRINMTHARVFPGSQVLCEFCWVSHYAVNKEKQHQSPCPPTLSLGMMRSSEPCLRNTFPAVWAGLIPIPSFVIIALVADGTLNSSAANFKTAVNGVLSGTLSTLYGSRGSDVRVILNVTLDIFWARRLRSRSV